MATLLEAQTKFQNIKIVPDAVHPGEIALYLDGAWQLGTFHEYRYHESLVTLPMAAAPAIDNVLICGGGDGMSLREALRFPGCGLATQVEIDGGMIEIWRDDPKYAKYNDNSMKSGRARVIVGDALAYARATAERYDVVILDFPSPGDGNAEKNYVNLFSAEALRAFVALLKPHGVLSMQVSVRQDTLAGAAHALLRHGLYVWQYDTYYDERGNHDSFMVASKHRLTQERIIPPVCRFATPAHVEMALSNTTEIGEDEARYYTLFCHQEHVEHELPYEPI